jgi:hypothetical protein
MDEKGRILQDQMALRSREMVGALVEQAERLGWRVTFLLMSKECRELRDNW